MKIFRWIAALALSVAGLWFALHGTDWSAVWKSFQQMKQPGWLLLFPLYGLYEFVMRTLRWNVLLSPLKKASLMDFLPITAAAFFLNNILPFRAGELARAYWTRRRAEIPFISTLAILAVDRIFDMISLLTVISVILVFKASLFPSMNAVYTFGIVTGGGLFAFIMMAMFPDILRRWTAHSWVPAKIAIWAAHFLEGAQALKNPINLLKAYGASLSFWGVNVLLVYFIGNLFFLSWGYVDAAWLVVALCFGVMLPSAPGYVGTFEAAGVTALGIIGIDKATALSFVLTIHISQILYTVIWGIPSLLMSDLKMPGHGESKDAAPSK